LRTGNDTSGLQLKKTVELGAHLAFLDESGFLLIPTRSRTWGPKGKTPIVRYSYRHDRISALAALTVSAKQKHMGLYTRFQRENFKAVHVAEFLRALLSHIRGPIILLWDGGNIHKGPKIRKVLIKNPRLRIEWFPGYAPELDPVEQVWNDFKRHTANSMPLTRHDIRISLHANSRRAQSSQAKLRSYILSSELPSPTW
jgi:transposase